MNKFEGFPQSEVENKIDIKKTEQPEMRIEIGSEQLSARDTHIKTPEELQRIEMLKQEFSDLAFNSLTRNKSDISDRLAESKIMDGHQYAVEYVPKAEIYPAFGFSDGSTAKVREDLSPRIKNFVKAHELYHCQDKANWGGWVGREIRANVVPGLKDPIGLLATVWKTVSDVDRMKFYWDRLKKGY